jgi:hypothetical protein
MEQPTPIEWLQEVYKVTGTLKESDFNYANNWTKENTYTEEQYKAAIKKAWFDSTMQFDNSAEMTYKKSFDDYYQSLKQPKQ